MNASPVYSSRWLRSFDLGFPTGRVTSPSPTGPVVLASTLKLAEAFLRPLSRTKSKLQHEIRAFGDLPENWDSYGSSPISILATQNALAGLDALAEHGLVPENVSPTPDESILFEINLDERELFLEFFKDGGIVVLEKTGDVKKISEIEAGQLGETIAGLTNVSV